MDELPVFRASKRRKFAQQRSEAALPADEVSSRPSGKDAEELEDEINVSELLRMRKQNKRKSAGIQFQNQKRFSDSEDASSDLALAKIDLDEEKLRDMSSRFIGSTGQVVDVDKHMMAYIDSEMAKRQNITAQDLAKQQLQPNSTKQERSTKPAQSKSSDYPAQAQLSEFDLGSDAQERNLARTTAAIARAHSGLPPPPEKEPKPRRPRKPRLGRDGKPYRPKPRKGRNSEDIARDALVEQMLHEHRMDVYEGDQDAEWDVHEDDSDMDERLAEQFKQEFMDAMTERQQKNQVKAATAARAKGMGPDQSGPKLGGSRSARAKMAQMQQQSQPQKSGSGSK